MLAEVAEDTRKGKEVNHVLDNQSFDQARAYVVARKQCRLR